MNLDPTYLAQHVSAFLESPYRPVLILLPFLPWAWLVSSKLDKDAKYFHFKHERWNGIHLAAGAVALAAMLGIPIFWVGWPLGILILLAPVLIYWHYRNQQVPADQRFTLSSESVSDWMAARKQSKATRQALIQFIGAEGEPQDVPIKEDPLFPIHMMAEDLIGPALDSRASMVEVAVGKDGAAVTQSVDGIRYKRPPLAADAALKAVDYVKRVAGVDVEDRRRRQTTDFGMSTRGGKHALSLTTAGSSAGVVLRIEFDRANRLSIPFDNLGMLPSQMEHFRAIEADEERHGIVLVGAPPGQGLTTTMYSLIGRHDAYTSNIKTLEREIFLRIDGVDHVLWDPNKPEVDYATHLQSILRRDPDVVMLAQVKETETAQVATASGMQGPLLYIPQRASTVIDQLREWVKQVGDVKKATRTLRVVSNQRLLRRLCPNCRQAYTPTAEQLKKLNLPAAKVQQLYRANGKVQVKNKIENCPVCGGTGYLGQVGIFEVLFVDGEMRRMLAGGDLKAALGHARRKKMIYLQEAALSKVAAGETTIEEVGRVLAPAKGGGSPPRPQPETVSAG
jgi:type II secretory ATPase GspE/PulE/Tfp pilus assembly ATPase PilB-like protein